MLTIELPDRVLELSTKESVEAYKKLDEIYFKYSLRQETILLRQKIIRYERAFARMTFESKKNPLKKKLLELTGGLCVYCRCNLTIRTVTIDHYIPKARGGTDEADNLLPACEVCNNKKGDDLPEINFGQFLINFINNLPPEKLASDQAEFDF